MDFLRRFGNGVDAFFFSLERSLAPETRRALSGLVMIFIVIALTSVLPGWTVIVFLAAALYFLPTMLAWGRHETVAGIFALNLLLGWTFIGWVFALSWALSKPRLITA